MSVEVKWLYPGADQERLQGETSDQEMESELQTDQSVQGSSRNDTEDQSSDTPSGADSGAVSPLEELPLDQMSTKVAAASNYMGSFLGWGQKQEVKKPEVKKEEEEVQKSSGGFGGLGMMTSAFGKLPSFSAKAAPSSEEQEEKEVKQEGKGWLGQGLTSLTSSLTMEAIYSAAGATTAKEQEGKQEKQEGKQEKQEGKQEKQESIAEEEQENWGVSFTDAFSKVGKMTSDYTKVLQDTVYKTPLIAEFNMEQEDFIRKKGGKEQESAPWSGYQGEEELKTKILGLSEDRRNFLRAPPQGVDFDFEYSAVAAHAVVLLEQDERLRQMRYELVPKKVKEDDFWRNYFYRVGLAKQSFELADSLATTSASTTATTNPRLQEEPEQSLGSAEQEEEFVSDLHQASSKDLAEADEAMKKLGLTKNDAEWEAELEGELNEYEMVGGEEEELSEEQIQAMLEAEK